MSKKFSGEASAVDTVPEYPTFPLEANIQARVVLNGVIAANGTLRDVRLVSLPLHSNQAGFDGGWPLARAANIVLMDSTR